MENEINYDKLVEKALKQVVIEALKIAADEGLPGENHFYISFKTNFNFQKYFQYLSLPYSNKHYFYRIMDSIFPVFND